MSPTKKKTPAPKKTTAKKPAPKAAAAATKSSKPTAKTEKPAAKKAAAKSAPAAPKKAVAAAPAARSAEKTPEKKSSGGKATEAASIAKTPPARPVPPAKAPTVAAAKTVPTKGGDTKVPVKPETPAKAKPATGKKGDEEGGTSTKRAKPRKPVTPTGPRHPKLGYRWGCYRCNAKFYDLGKDEPLCPKCGADQRDRPADEPKQHSSDHAKPRVVRPMAQLLDDDEPVAPHVEDDLGLDDVAEAGDMFEGDGDINHLEIDAAELADDTIEASEPDEF